jgi:putative hydrolase of the HAD superfamily
MIRTRSAPEPDSRLRHIDAWVFDLDNTLYPASCNLFGQIDRRMAEFIAVALSVDQAEARRIQKAYFRDYGTTLGGLMTNHGTDPEAFLEYVHAIDMTPLAPSPALEAALARLEGRKIVFTNGSARHADKVMVRLGVAQHFDGVFDIAAAEYRSKPDPEAYRALIHRHGLSPRTTAIFEDLPQNLAPAAAMGMTTVWVRNVTRWAEAGAEDGPRCDFVDHVTDDLVAWLQQLVAARKGGA